MQSGGAVTAVRSRVGPRSVVSPRPQRGWEQSNASPSQPQEGNGKYRKIYGANPSQTLVLGKINHIGKRWQEGQRKRRTGEHVCSETRDRALEGR